MDEEKLIIEEVTVEEDTKSIQKKKKKKKSILAKLVKRHKVGALIILFLLIVSNTYAWFLYTSVVGTDIDAHVRTFNVSIDGVDQKTYTFEIDELYPGKNYPTQELTLTNYGEAAANISLRLESIVLFGETYNIDENGVLITNNPMNDLATALPFKIVFNLSNTSVNTNASSKISLDVNWPYEATNPYVQLNKFYDYNSDFEYYKKNGADYALITDPENMNNYFSTNNAYLLADDADTYWGDLSYNYHKANPGASSLVINVAIQSTQVNS